jgi:hypothetical protein
VPRAASCFLVLPRASLLLPSCYFVLPSCFLVAISHTCRPFALHSLSGYNRIVQLESDRPADSARSLRMVQMTSLWGVQKNHWGAFLGGSWKARWRRGKPTTRLRRSGRWRPGGRRHRSARPRPRRPRLLPLLLNQAAAVRPPLQRGRLLTCTALLLPPPLKKKVSN